MRSSSLLVRVLVASLTALTFACGTADKDLPIDGTTNHAPTLSAPTVSASSVVSNTAVTLQASANDLDGDSLSYIWAQTPATPAGAFSNTASSDPTWTSPVVSSAQSFTLTVTVSDGKGASVQGSVSVQVTPPVAGNQSPTLTAGPMATAGTVSSGGSVTVSVTASDPESDTLTYAWTQVSPASPEGNFNSPTSSSTSWTAPTVTTNTEVTLRVTVSDGRGGNVQGEVNVTVEKPAGQNTAPVVGANISGPTSFIAGGTAPKTFSISASDADGDTLTYSWSQTAGPAGTFHTSTTGSSVQWYSPAVAASTPVTLSVTVSDGNSTPVTRTLDVTVTVPAYTDVQGIFNAQCSGCHGSSGGLSLASGSSYSNLINVAANNGTCSTLVRVKPGDPDQSLLVKKIEGTTCGTRMPASNPTYFASNPWQVVLIRSWILAGAANN